MNLDLGCGEKIAVPNPAIGCDIDIIPLQKAKSHFPANPFIQCAGEMLPFRDAVFDHISCGVSMPYMNVRAALGEANRVLAPGGTLYASFHRFRFTLFEIKRSRTLRGLLGRVKVIANGLCLHFFGRQFHGETFQTHTAIIRELRLAGFHNVRVVKQWPLAFACEKLGTPIPRAPSP